MSVPVIGYCLPLTVTVTVAYTSMLPVGPWGEG